eukprot:scaffold94181_cov59-Phaeocystis_antarctica.AAC.4
MARGCAHSGAEMAPELCRAEGEVAASNARMGVTLPYEEARALVRALGLASSEEYKQFLASGAELERADPEAWNGGHALRLREKAAAVGVDTGRLPALPDLKYRAEWAGWEDWLGPG